PCHASSRALSALCVSRRVRFGHQNHRLTTTFWPLGTSDHPDSSAACLAAHAACSIHALAWRVITSMVRPPTVKRRYMWLTLGGMPGNTTRSVVPPPSASVLIVIPDDSCPRADAP